MKRVGFEPAALAIVLGLVGLGATPPQGAQGTVSRRETAITAPKDDGVPDVGRLNVVDTPIQARDFQEGERFAFLDGQLYQNAILWNDQFWKTRLDPTDEALGATLQPLGEPLRSQLKVAEGQGLIVVSLRRDGPCAQAGLRQYDILLSLGEKPLKQTQDIEAGLRAAGEEPVELKALRMGKPLSLKVRPITRMTLGPALVKEKEYYIGVSAAAVDDSLRGHLGLAEGEGVTINEVVANSPAEKVGIKVHDVLLELGGKKLNSLEVLKSKVQELKETAATAKLLRAGQPMTLTITPSVREVARESAPVSYSVDLPLVENRYQLARRLNSTPGQTLPYAVPVPPTPVAPSGNVWTGSFRSSEVQQLQSEVKALRDTIAKLEKAIEALKGTVHQ